MRMPATEVADRSKYKAIPQLQRNERRGATESVSSTRGSASASMRVGGTRCLIATRSFFEPRFGQSFAGVRIHTGAQAARSAESIGATAYTIGRDIVFGANQYSPHTSEGRRLLAHELTHVVQQSQSTGTAPMLQRDIPKPGSAADKIEKTKKELTAKYWLKEISQEGKAVWTESLLKKLDTSFSKMSAEDQKRLQRESP